MAKSEKELLEDILVAQVLTISHLMDAKQLTKGITRTPADYTREALQEIKKDRSKILAKLYEQV